LSFILSLNWLTSLKIKNNVLEINNWDFKVLMLWCLLTGLKYNLLCKDVLAIAPIQTPVLKNRSSAGWHLIKQHCEYKFSGQTKSRNTWRCLGFEPRHPPAKVVCFIHWARTTMLLVRSFKPYLKKMKWHSWKVHHSNPNL
jgi:hypothetical protein